MPNSSNLSLRRPALYPVSPVSVSGLMGSLLQHIADRLPVPLAAACGPPRHDEASTVNYDVLLVVKVWTPVPLPGTPTRIDVSIVEWRSTPGVLEVSDSLRFDPILIDLLLPQHE